MSLHKGMNKVGRDLMGLQLGVEFSTEELMDFVSEHKQKKDCQFMGCCLA